MTELNPEVSSDNNIIYFTRLHWIIFFGPLIGLCVPVALYYYIPQLRQPTQILLVLALCWIVMTWFTYYFSSITIKKRQVILRTGLIVRQTVDVPLTKIETIDIRQSILGSLLGYGTLLITGTGGTRHQVTFLQRPLTCRRYIEQLMNQ